MPRRHRARTPAGEPTSAEDTTAPRSAAPAAGDAGAWDVAHPEEIRALSDQLLLEGIRAASEPHFDVLYERYFSRIYAFVHARVRNHADAEEIAQETFVSVFKSIDNYRGQASLLSWIFGIAKNLANNAIRRARSQREKLDVVDPEHFAPRPCFGAGAPDEELDFQRYAEIIREQMDALADWQRRIFEMRHLQNLSIPEIARRTHRSNDAVRSSLYRMKRMMLEAADLVGGARVE